MEIGINLLSVPFLPHDYSHVMDFESIESRNDWFFSKVKETVYSSIKYDNMRTYILLNKPIQEVRTKYDYLFYDDCRPDIDNEFMRYFYFITDYEFITESVTKIYIQLDIWTTYFFAHSLMTSFVERCHVPRWNENMLPTSNFEDEGVNTGDMLQIEEPTEICEFNESLVVVSSVPIGYIPSTGNGTGGIGGSGEWWREGKISPKCFRFLKGMEGFGQYPYQDGGGYWTIAYGVTKHGEESVYNNLASQVPLDEEVGAKASYELKNSNYAKPIVSTCEKLGVSNQGQFDALVSLAYNCGTGAVTGDNSLMQAIANNINDESTIRPIWESFRTTSNGIPQPGLVTRRKNECNMFFGQEYEIRDIGIITGTGQYNGVVTENDGNGWLPEDYGTGETGDLNGYKSFSNNFGDNWLCPVKGATVSSVYGWRIHPIQGTRKFHHGTDIGLAQGNPTVASKSGTITSCGWNDSMGYYIYLDTPDGFRVKYMHLSKIDVKVGDQVKRGDKVGEIGNTGGSKGAHSHWEIRRLSDNESTNPAPSLKVGDKV